MRAVIFDGEVRVTEIPIPRPAEGEALVRVLTAGICNTDLEIIQGYMGFSGVIGHEFVGIVEQCTNPHLQGKRVVGEINCVCHKCAFCGLEMPHHCMNRTVLGIQNRQGAFAEFLTLPEENLHLVPNSIRDDVAVFTMPTGGLVGADGSDIRVAPAGMGTFHSVAQLAAARDTRRPVVTLLVAPER